MKSILIFLAVTLFFFGLIETTCGQTLSNNQKLTIEKQVDSIFHVMVKAAESLDFNKLNSGVDDRFHAGFIANGVYYSEYDSLINYVKTRSAGILNQQLTLQKEKVTLLSENIVLLMACGDAKVETNSGNFFTSKFYWSFVYEKINNIWKVVQSHQSNVRQ
jgi:hypothetical protein